ncbi:MAG: aminotransferase class I/II-fold pyridoxal phosphate-dependent enzyme [Halobacteriales archaeon]|nr:aminotransferase class I/II-fold pyridoxal phosphate-dependent enzyme [Halobacteriales archaeon]
MRRELRPVDKIGKHRKIATEPGTTDPNLKDEEFLVFASNNYLGLARDDRVQEAAIDAIRDVGTGAGSARLLTGDTTVHHELERTIADKKDTERAVVFSSGYATNIGTIPALHPDVIFTDELNHMCIEEGCELSNSEVVTYDHVDMNDLEDKLAERGESEDSSWLIVTDSVFSMDGNIAPLETICDLADEYGAWVMADEAHATGLYENGGGIVQEKGLTDRVEIQMGTLSKALASQGGYVAGSEPLVKYLANAARSFVFSAGLAPPLAGAAREALRIAAETDRPKRLWENTNRLREGLIDCGFEINSETQILPVIVGDRDDAEELAEAVQSRGIFAPSVVPPVVPQGTSRIRVAPMATHTEAEIDRCISVFQEEGQRIGII